MSDRNTTLRLEDLSQLRGLFEALNSGRHLNRYQDPALWADLDEHRDAYVALFEALGYQLRVDERGFAWFHTGEASSTVSKGSRKLALFFMLLFECQADQGRHLGKFHAWIVDTAVLDTLWERNRDLLGAEEMADPEALRDVVNTGIRYGFIAPDTTGGWRLLPAVYRYLDHFEELSEQLRGQMQEDAMVTTLGDGVDGDEIHGDGPDSNGLDRNRLGSDGLNSDGLNSDGLGSDGFDGDKSDSNGVGGNEGDRDDGDGVASHA